MLAQRPQVGPVPAPTTACVNCHRPSGMGQREGKLLVPAIAGHILFAPLHRPTFLRTHPGLKQVPLRAYDRPAYHLQALASAVRQGVDVAGRPLNVAMPRYALTPQDAADLAAYLQALSARPLPGAAGGVLHLATVVAPDATPQARRAVEVAVAAWASQLALGAWQVRWSQWTLTGPASGWAEQLDKHWQRQPVFAMVSGAGGTQWAPVANFCETHELPCVFPTLDATPHGAEKAHFNFYLSAGVKAEAALLGRWQAQAGPPTGPPTGRVIQLVADQDPAAAIGARLLQAELLPQVAATETLAAAADPGVTARAAALALAAAREGDTVVLWARDAAVSAALAAAPPGPGLKLWSSATLAPVHRVVVPAAWRSRVFWASVHSDEVRRNAGGSLSTAPWAQALNLPDDLDPLVLSDVYAATFFFTDALARMREGLNVEYFNERLEDTVDLRPASAGYFRLSLGPNQRIAAQGGHIIGQGSEAQAVPRPVSPYLRAELGVAALR